MVEVGAQVFASPPLPSRMRVWDTKGGSGVAFDRERGPRPIESGSRTVYLVTPVTYDASKADEEEVARAFDKVVKDGAAQGALDASGVASVGFCVIQPSGDEIPLGIESQGAA